jgi:hypothetical protein
MLDALVARYGPGAVVVASPYVDETGETFRWELTINGKEPTDADLSVTSDPERADVFVVRLVHRDEEVELGRWSTTRHPDGPASIVRTLRELA